jgi:molybdate transport system substrate-binding protein
MTRVCLILLALLVGSGTDPVSPSPRRPVAPSESLTVFAAASLTEAFQELGTLFERGKPAAKVIFSFAASSLLRTQIEQGAPADLFASADREQMEPLARAGLVQKPLDFARNRLAIVTPAANPGQGERRVRPRRGTTGRLALAVRRPQDLARAGLRLVITAEVVPVGRYTRQALAKMSAPGAFGSEFQPAVMRNVVSQEPNVRGLLTKVTLGEADAAIVYVTDALAAGDQVRVVPIPVRYNETAVYPVAIVARSPHAAAAARFLALLRSKTGRAILKKRGFEPA